MDSCLICDTKDDTNDDSWIQCDPCGQWFHMKCLSLTNAMVDTILSYHCSSCSKAKGPTEYKRKSKRSRANIDYVALNDGDVFAVDKSVHPHVTRFFEFPMDANLKNDDFIEILDYLTVEYAVTSHLTKPVLVPNSGKSIKTEKGVTNAVGMTLPVAKEHLTIDYILEQVGEEEPVEVMDVLSQQGVSPRWNMKQWRDYFVTDKDSRDRIRNVISLEISQVPKLGIEFKRPDMVDGLDLIDKVWVDRDERPQVTKYCLMSVDGSFTDFHIDFGGTSVYYTVCSGAKTFLMFPPTEENLCLYTMWCLEPNQNFMWFPDYKKTIKGKATVASRGFKVTLNPGDVFIIPSGWIHAVYTPADSIVIGGNFLTMMNMKTQLDIYSIEKSTKVPMKFRHPQFNKVLWVAAWYYLHHQDEFLRDTGNKEETVKKEITSTHPTQILTSLHSHLTNHFEVSKTSQLAKKSIPIHLIGKDVAKFLDSVKEWCMIF